MLVIAQVRLTSPFLGELRPDDRGVRRFRMNSRKPDLVAVNQTGWLDDLVAAAHTMKLGVNVRKTVLPPDGLLPASVHLLRRTFSGAHVEYFESFRKGAVITFDLLLNDQKPNCPTMEQLQQILGFSGEHFGISQWGKKFGFGRFAVLSLQDRYPAPDAPPLSDTTPVPVPPQPTGTGSPPVVCPSHDPSEPPA